MTHHSLVSFLVLLLTAASAPANAQSTSKYWIFFERGTTVVADDSPAGARALTRRAVRGTPGSLDPDAPVAREHLATLRSLGIEPEVVSRWLNAVSAYLTGAQLQTVSQLEFVRSLRPVARKRRTEPLDEAPLPPEPASKAGVFDYGLSRTQLELMNAVAPLERGINGAGVRLGFLDTEFGDFQHPVFARLVDEGRLIAVRNFVGASQSNRHGLNVASVAVGFAEGSLIGPAYGAEVLAATTEYAPSETNAEEDYFVAGLEWLESQGADVVNVSLGYTTFDDGQRSYTYEDLDGDTGVTTIAADIAASLGVIVVASAGNEGGCPPPTCWHFIGTPADGDSVIAVGAVRADSARASFSSFGPTADGRIKPDVAAMGSQVVTANSGGGYIRSGGTSFSSPLVAGVVCQILQVNPWLNPIEVRDLLRRTASQADSPDNALGWGIINADAAVRGAQEALFVDSDVPETVELIQPFPNPAAGHANIRLRVPSRTQPLRLAVYDVLGREVAVLSDQPLKPGEQTIPIDTARLAPGVYIIILLGDGVRATARMVVAR